MRVPVAIVKDAIRATVVSWVGVGLLVGNAYMVCNVGYPSVLETLGGYVVVASMVFALPPALGLEALGLLGVDIPLRGRESFITMNMWLWVYCAVFYSVFLFLILCYRRRRARLKAEREVT